MNMILEILGTLIALAFLYLYRNNGKENLIEPTNEVEDKRQTLKIYCERINGVHYAWFKESMEFIGQANTANDMAKTLMSKFPLKTYNLIIEEKNVS